MLFRVHSKSFTEVVLLVVGRHGFFANLNLSGEVKGRALGMRLKYPQAAKLSRVANFAYYTQLPRLRELYMKQ